MPARPCLTDHRSRRSRQSGQGRRAPSTTTVAVPGHVLRGEQQDRRGPGDRLRQGLDGPRDRGLGHTELLADHRLRNVVAHVDQHRLQSIPQSHARRTPLDPLLAQTDEQVGELGSGQPRGILHGDGPFLMSLLTLFTGHHTSWERAIIISFPGNATRCLLNNLPRRALRTRTCSSNRHSRVRSARLDEEGASRGRRGPRRRSRSGTSSVTRWERLNERRAPPLSLCYALFSSLRLCTLCCTGKRSVAEDERA